MTAAADRRRAARGGFFGRLQRLAVAPPAPTLPVPPRGTVRPDTHMGRVLAAAGELVSGEAGVAFAPAAAVVAAWRRHPDGFGLDGYEQEHPDAGMLRAHLSKLTAAGYLTRDAPKRLALTPEGARWWGAYGRAWLAAQERAP